MKIKCACCMREWVYSAGSICKKCINAGCADAFSCQRAELVSILEGEFDEEEKTKYNMDGTENV